MGAEVIEKKDGFIINPGNMLHNAKIETFSDHRIAMAFSIAGLLTGKKNILDNKECVDISFPGFFTMLNGIISELQLQFVKAPARQRALEDQVAETEAVRETFTNPKDAPSEIIADEEE